MYSAPYPTHMGYQHGYVHEEHAYPEYAPQGGPTRTYGPPAQHQPQPSSNPFIPMPVQPSIVLSTAQKRNSRKKRRGVPLSATPVVPQPLGNAALTPEVLPKLPQNPSPSTQQLAPPGQKWVLIADTAPASVPPAPIQPAAPEAGKPEPESTEFNVELKEAQAAVNRMQLIVCS